jgi:cell wall-associated NlpC family hydrolase
MRMGTMRILVTPTLAALVCGLALCASRAQEQPRSSGTSSTVPQSANEKRGPKTNRTLTKDDRLSVIAAALDSRGRHSEHDCSHLVHAIYERAGFPYQYASSDDLYAGTGAFERVKRPQPGDLVVWPGHVGIVIRPSRHVFFSFLSTGPGTDDYEAPYWRSRGRPRFYRYVRNDSCPRCVPVRGTPTVVR